MQDTRNIITAIVLSAAILFGWQYFFAPPIEPAPETQQAQSQNAVDPTTDSGLPSAQDAPASANNGDGIPTAAATAQPVAPAPRLTVVNQRLNGSINLRGARLDDLTLAGYRTELDESSENVTLLSPRTAEHPYFADFGWVAANGTDLGVPTAKSIWQVVGNQELSPNNPVTLRFTAKSGLVFERVIALDENYLFTVTDRITNNTGSTQALYPYARVLRIGLSEAISKSPVVHEGAYGVFQSAGENAKLEEVSYKGLADDKEVRFSSTGGWLGITDKYWMTAVIPEQTGEVAAKFKYLPNLGQGAYQAEYLAGAKQVEAGGTVSVTHRLFAGAKEVNLIDDYRDSQQITRFDLAIDWGWLYFLTKPMFQALHWLYTMVGNFGVAILLLVLGVKILFFPLANKSYESMSRMKKVQPELMKLRERHKDDPQAQQKEMMELYKREKVNPLAGCLPLLIQIPVFFALYKVLFVSIEMRHAPFFGWIQDLSAPDPLTLITGFGLFPWDVPGFLAWLGIGIWPLLMGISMFLQQKLNPPPADPTQAKIFMLMPIFFTFLLGTFPAGLVIYWTANNVLSILQQYVIMRRMGVAIGGGEEAKS